MRWPIILLILTLTGIQTVNAQIQRGSIIRTASTTVMDPNQDRYVSGRNPQTGVVTPNTPFSNKGYYVDEFEIPMFGLPKVGLGDVAGDNIGKICGVTDLIPDNNGYSVYASRDPNNNLIFRFRVGDDRPSVESYSILIDTDGLFGSADPNATTNNPGFELMITMIKRNNAGVMVYNIDGTENCPTPLKTYPLSSHFQIAVADEVTCGNLDYFYDYFVPFSDIANLLGIDEFTGLRYVAVTNVSATCAFGGKIADISGVDYNDYKDCLPCAFTAIVEAQCPTPIVDLRQDGPGFDIGLVNPPTIDEPIRAGQTSVSGTSESGLFIRLDIFARIGGTEAQPIWSTTARETKITQVVNNVWEITLDGPLQAYDRIVARAQKNAEGVDCGIGAGNEASSTSITVVEPNELPIALDQEVEVFQNSFVDIVLVATDADGDPLSYTIVSPPSNGTLSGTAPNVRYTPNPGYLGSDSFSFTSNDGAADSNIGTVSIQVVPVNQPPNATPVAGGDCFEVTEDTPKLITLQASDPDGDALTFIIVTQPLHGVLTGSGPDYTYTPNANYFGADTFTFKVNDGQVDSNVAGVCIDVINVNDPPVAIPVNPADPCIEVIEDTPRVITLQATDPDGDVLTYIIVTGPSHGTLTGTGPNFTYTPNANYFGPDSFIFKVNDGEFDSNEASVCIVVSNVNDPPVAIPVNPADPCIEVIEDTPKVITLQATDPDGDVLTYIIVTSPTHGTLTGTGPDFTYTPNADYFGADSFTFKVNDGEFDSNEASVCINVLGVNDPPVAIPVNPADPCIEVIEDTPKVITLQATDADGDVLTYSIVSGPSNGTLTGTAPNFTYTPNANYFGPDSFIFKVNDGEFDSNEASVCINVLAVNDPPFITGTVNSIEYVFSAGGILLDNFLQVNDVDNTSIVGITVSISQNFKAGDQLLVTAEPGITANYNAATGVLELSGTASLANYSSTIASIIFLNDTDLDPAALTRRISFVARDQEASGPAYHIFVDYPGNTAPVANSIEAPNCIELLEDNPGDITLTATDDDGDLLTYIIVSPPVNGTLTGSGPVFTYTPDLDYFGPDSFTFKVNDGKVDSNTAGVCLTILPVNDPPVAVADAAITLTNVAVTFNITANDTDVDGTVESSTIDLDPANPGKQKTFTVAGEGTYEVDNNGDLTFTPAFNFQGVATPISYTVEDNEGALSNEASITVTVNLGLLRPVAVADAASTHVNIEITFNITANDFDTDGNIEPSTVDLDPSTAGEQKTFAVTGEGEFTVDALGNVTFTPETDFNGTVAITYTVKDNDGLLSNEAAITVEITIPNNVPVILTDPFEFDVPQDTPTDITLSAQDDDGDVLTYIIVTPPGNGILTGTGPVFTYTPNAGFTGTDTFTFKVNDGTDDSNVATVVINVIPANQAPLAVNDEAETEEETPVTFNITDNDTDADGVIDPSTVDLDPATAGEQKTFTVGAEGTFTVDNAGNLTFTPEAGFIGTSSITYTVKDDDGALSNEATISVIVNEIVVINTAPLADDLSFEVDQDTAKDITLTGSDDDGDAITFIIVTQPSQGTLTGTEPTYTYTPDAGYTGADSFTYKVNDGTEDSEVATVSITVLPVIPAPVNIAPVISAIPVLYVPQDSTLLVCIGVTDINGDDITYGIPTRLSGEGTMLPSTEFGFCYVYTPPTGYTGETRWNIGVCDDGAPILCDDIDVTIIVMRPPVAVDDSTTTFINTVISFNIFENDSSEDSELDVLSIDLNPATEEEEKTFELSGEGNFVVDELGMVTFTPINNFLGEVIISYTIKDNYFVRSNEASIKVKVEPTPVPVNPNDLFFDVLEDVPTDIELTSPAAADEVLSFIVVTQPSNGTLSGTSPNLVYLSNLNYNGPDQFTFRVNNGFNNSEVATAFINVLPVNDPPLAANDTLTVQNDQVASINVLANDFDVDGDDLTLDVTPVDGPSHGSVIFEANGNITYTPDPTYAGPDFITYRVYDNGSPVLDDLGLIVITVVFPPLKIYNAVSPNNDGQNDYWRIDGIETYTENQVRLFDRYNNMVYTMKGYKNNDGMKSWWGEANNGLTKGTLPEGTYYYVIDLGDGSKPLSGYLVLKRN